MTGLKGGRGDTGPIVRGSKGIKGLKVNIIKFNMVYMYNYYY